MILSIIFGVLSILFCILFCVARTKRAGVCSLSIKTLASVCFLLCGIFALRSVDSTTFGLLIVAGGIFGLIGDIILDLKVMYEKESNQYFVFGTTSFAIGHVFYFVAALLYNQSILPEHILWNVLVSIIVAIILTLAIMLPSKKLGINFGKMVHISAIYCLILTFMMAFAISIAIFSPIFWIFAGGMIAFFLSDLVLSLQYFGGKNGKSLVYVNHILYYLAQATIAFSIIFLVI